MDTREVWSIETLHVKLHEASTLLEEATHDGQKLDEEIFRVESEKRARIEEAHTMSQMVLEMSGVLVAKEAEAALAELSKIKAEAAVDGMLGEMAQMCGCMDQKLEQALRPMAAAASRGNQAVYGDAMKKIAEAQERLRCAWSTLRDQRRAETASQSDQVHTQMIKELTAKQKDELDNLNTLELCCKAVEAENEHLKRRTVHSTPYSFPADKEATPFPNIPAYETGNPAPTHSSPQAYTYTVTRTQTPSTTYAYTPTRPSVHTPPPINTHAQLFPPLHTYPHTYSPSASDNEAPIQRRRTFRTGLQIFLDNLNQGGK